MTYDVTVAVAMTEWEHADAGHVQVAACGFVYPRTEIERISELWLQRMTKGQLIEDIGAGMRDNQHITNMRSFAGALAAYVGQTQLFQEAKRLGPDYDGLWLRVMTNRKLDGYVVMPSVCAPAARVGRWLNKIIADPNSLDVEERKNLLASSKHPEITGLPELAQPEALLGLNFVTDNKISQSSAEMVNTASFGIATPFGAGKSRTLAKAWWNDVPDLKH